MVMGPTCGLILADLGADVVKVEPPKGDRTRYFKGPAAGFFATYCRNKRSVAIDTRRGRPDGRAAADREQRRPDRKFPPRPAEADRSRLRVGRALRATPHLLLAERLFAGPLRESPRARRGRADDGRACLHDRPAGPADARRRLGQRHHGWHVRRDRHSGRTAERQRTGRGRHIQSALYENNVFLMAQAMMCEVVSGQPSIPYSDQGQPLAGLRPLRHQGRLEALRHHRR